MKGDTGPPPSQWNPQSSLLRERTRQHPKRFKHVRDAFRWVILLALCSSCVVAWFLNSLQSIQTLAHIPRDSQKILAKCAHLNDKPGPPPRFHWRVSSDRHVPGTPPVLIHNATIWTGGNDGREVIHGEILLAEGMILAIGRVDAHLANLTEFNLLVRVDAHGAWVTPGIVDMHSHLSNGPSPALNGAEDTNSLKSIINGWLRSLDGFNTHDESFKLAIAGGVTTSLVLPGSADAMGGQAFALKHRPTKERSPSSMLLEPPYGINGEDYDHELPPRWRHMKHACGENPSRVFGGTRMDTAWAWRQAYDKARLMKVAQDEYCTAAEAGRWQGLGAFPEDLQWEALVDILRGKVKVQTHCYEAVDIDDFVRISNEFKFEIAAFHHAHEAYLVPDVLKRAYGRPPAAAIFGTFSRYKREAYRHSEYAPRVLSDEGIQVAMKSDHPGIVSRYLLHEAQQAHHYGLPANLAMSSVISTPATVLGLDHRIGYVKTGYDADLVIWDSHPLMLGATPKQVFIDGIPQLEHPYVVDKPLAAQREPKVPNYDNEREETLRWDGLPPLAPHPANGSRIVFTNIRSLWKLTENGVEQRLFTRSASGTIVVHDGRIVCINEDDDCLGLWAAGNVVVDLKGGALGPGLVSFGSMLGLQEIQGEDSTKDGVVYDILLGDTPSALGQELIRAVDGLQFGTRDALLAYRGGVTTSITAPYGTSLLSGFSTVLSLGAMNKIQPGAVIQDIAALHVSIQHLGIPSVSTQIAALRRLLLGSHPSEASSAAKDVHIQRVIEGVIPLVVDVQSADVMATLLSLKTEVEDAYGHTLKMVFSGATEAHLLAPEISAATVGVIVTPPRSFPYAWESRRIMPGPPLSEQNLVSHLLSHNITVGIGPQGVMGMKDMSDWAVRNLRFDAGWIYVDAGGAISREQTYALAATNVAKLLGVDLDGTVAQDWDLVATSGGDLLDFESKVVGVMSPRRGLTELF